MLIEQGRLRLVDRVATFIPGFERYGKADITVRHLLTHVSGLRPDVDLGDAWTGSDTAIQLAIEEIPTAPPNCPVSSTATSTSFARRDRSPRQRHAARSVVRSASSSRSA